MNETSDEISERTSSSFDGKEKTLKTNVADNDNDMEAIL